MSFFSNLVGGAITTGVNTLVSGGAKALVNEVFGPDETSVGSLGAATSSRNTVDNQLKSVIDDTKQAGFLGEVPSVGGILPRSAGRAELASSQSRGGGDMAKMIALLGSPQVATPDATELLQQLRVATRNVPSSSRRQKQSLKKLFNTG